MEIQELNSVSFQFEKKVLERGSNRNKYLETMDNSGIPLQALNTVNRGGRRSRFSARQKSSTGAKKYTAGHRVFELRSFWSQFTESRVWYRLETGIKFRLC